MNDFNYKSLTLQQLQWVFKDVLMPPKFKLQPRWHQLVSLFFAADENRRRICYFHDVGTGKTLAAYYTAQLWGCEKILVICPTSAIGAWIRDIQWTNYSHQVISGTTEERKAKIQDNQDVSIIHYEGLKTIFAKLQDRKGGGRRWAIDSTALKHNFDCIIFDEIHRCNTYSSLQSKICLELSKRANQIIGLTGTPIDRILLEIFNIYKVLDLGASFGWNYWMFRREHFTPAGYDWRIRPKHKDKILQLMAASSLSFDQSECFDLPESQEEIIYLSATKEFRALEDRIINEDPLGLNGSSVIFKLDSLKGLKLKQLTDGFIYLDEDGERRTCRLKENPKLEALLDVIQGTGRKIIIFFEFDECGNIIQEALQKAGIAFAHIRGGLSLEERQAQEADFRDSVQVILVKTQAGSEGWDGSAASIVVFWDIVASPKVRRQCIGRMVRAGQQQKTLVYELILKPSINTITKASQTSRKSEVTSIMMWLQGYRNKI